MIFVFTKLPVVALIVVPVTFVKMPVEKLAVVPIAKVLKIPVVVSIVIPVKVFADTVSAKTPLGAWIVSEPLITEA